MLHMLLLLDLASGAFLGSESRGIYPHISLSLLRLPYVGVEIPVFIFLQNQGSPVISPGIV
jgi:hypothetical protein